MVSCIDGLCKAGVVKALSVSAVGEWCILYVSPTAEGQVVVLTKTEVKNVE